MLKTFKVSRECTDTSPLTCPSTTKSDGTGKYVTTFLIGLLQRPAGNPVCLEPLARGHHTCVIRRGSLPTMGAAEKG